MSEYIPGLIGLTNFYPRLRRAAQHIVIPAMRRWYQAGKQWAGHKSPASLMAWCGDMFGEKAVFHYLRIQRRIGQSMMLRGKFELTGPRPIQSRGIGYYLLHGFGKQRRRH